MDRRLIPGETREAALQEIRQLLDEYSRQVEPLKYELYSQGEVAANINTPPDAPLVRSAAQALQAVCHRPRRLAGYLQTSDGRWFARDGIPIIIFGPSDPAVAHAADEYAIQEQLVEAARFLTLLALRWLGVTEG
jgi:acetylornithine deacetylase/succinyl-diaminopimelate desuccinylase-like protein